MKKLFLLTGKIINFCGDIFFPKKCICCAKYSAFLCFECASKVVKIKTSVCHLCGKISHEGEICSGCKKREGVYFKSLIVSSDYHSLPVKEMIHNLKYNGLIELADYCGELIFESLRDVNSINDFVITYVPMYWKREGKRGFNQSKLIAGYVAKSLALPCFDLIKKIHDTKNQVGLNKGDRLKNILSSFEICDINLTKGRNVVLIDDVVTTGSTVNECAKMLIKAGANKVIVAVVAKNV